MILIIGTLQVEISNDQLDCNTNVIIMYRPLNAKFEGFNSILDI